jgi:hypothetical protein
MFSATLSRLTGRSCKVLVFLGAHQSKIPVERVRMLQPLGDRVEYVQIDGNGPNALDFHIAFYLGELGPTHGASPHAFVPIPAVPSRTWDFLRGSLLLEALERSCAGCLYSCASCE